MPMSEDVAGATMSMMGKTVSGAVDVSTKTLEALIRLLREINEAAEKRAERKFAAKQQKAKSAPTGGKGVVNTELMDSLKMKGRVSLPDLRKYAAASGESIVFSDQGLSKDDLSSIAKSAKAMGIPVAFSRSPDKKTYYPCISSEDAAAFKVILQGMIASKLKADHEKPASEREFCQRAVAKWELPFIAQECKRLDIQGSFAPHPTERNQIIFIYQKKDDQDAKSILDQIAKSCQELKNIKIEQDKDGFVTITDDSTGRVYSFDAATTSEEVLINDLQDKFGMNSMTARLTAAKFENDCLTPDQIEEFKQNEPHHAFYSFGELHISDPETGKENPVTAPYKMGYYACKFEDKPCFTISNPQGKTIVFSANEINCKTIREKLSSEFGIKNKALLKLLTDKVDQCARSLAKENLSSKATFKKEDFDLSNTKVAAGMRRTDASGNVFVKKQPLDTISLQIVRNGKNGFTVTSTAEATEYDESGEARSTSNTRELSLSLRDTKKSYESLKNALVSQGVPSETAKSMAKEAIKKAQSQPEKEIVYVDRMTNNTVNCFTASREAEIPIKDGTVDAEDIKEAFDVSEEAAKQGQERVSENIQNFANEAAQKNYVNEVRSSHQSTINDAVNRMHQNGNDMVIVCSAADPKKCMQVYANSDGGYTVNTFDGKRRTGYCPDLKNITDILETAKNRAGIEGEVLQFDSREEYLKFLDADMEVNTNEYEAQDYADEEDVGPQTNEETENAAEERNGHEMHPEGNVLDEQSESDSTDMFSNSGSSNSDAAPDIDDLFEDDDDMSMGAR